MKNKRHYLNNYLNSNIIAMEAESMIALNKFCSIHNVDISFVRSLQQSGLIEIITVEDSWFIEPDQLQQLEKFVRFYYDLNINLEGIETIHHLLERVNYMQNEIVRLKNKLSIFETENDG